ncbi:glycosyltransferase [Microbacterium sp. QXD-8]|uniref:Glycosyltransferase n=1 Tax=Microbacterium psychrotolerans TaxID=3068321 RepID=A0ABU0Z1B0_9MICO|nr:glycosyltransferase [Microbacterium sp. QXD-8]MDQ7878362.1 glycosyltransferase [Microbacterium sp. QXD-8]
MSAPIVVIEHLDPQDLVPSGIDTIVNDVIQFAPDREVSVVGITASDIPVGVWRRVSVGDRAIQFLPVARFDRRARRKLVPHSIRFIAGLFSHRVAIRSALLGAEVHTHRLETGQAAWLFGFGAPVQFIHNAAASLTGDNSDSVWRFAGPLYHALERAAVRGVRALVVFNRREAERLTVLAPGRCVSARTWYDPAVFRPMGATQSIEKNGIVWVGRLEEQKNPLLAIDVAAALRDRGFDAHLSMIGDGSLRPNVERAIERQGLSDRVSLVGALSREGVANELQQSALLLMTSHYEGSPTALIEALACGTKVVATTASDQDDLLTDSSRGATAPADVDALASAVTEHYRTEIAPDLAISSRAAPIAVPRLLNQIDAIVR